MPTIINNLKTRLTTKITAMLLAALCVALLAIGYTLWLSWQLEGAAAAINDSGSLRMRAWKIAALLNQTNQDRSFTPQQLAEVKTIQQQFEITLAELRKGDPQRPLFLPRQRQIQQQLTILERTWQQQFVPFLSNVQQYKHLNPQQAQIWLTQTNLFVEQIYQTVNLIEEEYARQTFWLRSSQMMLIFMAFIGTLVMIILLNLMIIRPVNSLHQGIQQMYNGDFSVRLTIEGEDEFAQLSAGFNAMANQLQQLYNNLEQRVNEKTESIAKKNRYLSVLYDFSQKLNQHHSLEELSRHFLQRLMLEFNATGGSVRLIDKTANKIYSVVDEGIPPSLSQQMQCQQLGSCFCTQAAEQAKTAINNLNQHFSPHFSHCLAAGFKMVLAIPIQTADKNQGIFNLHFSEEREISAEEILLLETLGQQLGIAIDNQRLTGKEKELAVFEERNLVAQGLHDSIVQSLSFLNIQLQLLQTAVKQQNNQQINTIIPLLQTGVQQGYEDLRELMSNFRSRYDDSQLEVAINAIIRRFSEQTNIPVTLKLDNLGKPLANNERLQILFIIQEALSNIRKHAQAKHININIINHADVDILINDDGIGFNHQEVQSSHHQHIGLKIMAERAKRINAQLDIESTPMIGTTIKLHLSQNQRQNA
ncbi:MAG TPA: type IV pili methyl-accepting chemotaxis transducer N-terminal domain-containing protein [Agitococcus sp.]|nr:type IV pili methyl-accepting chemotaxis transducer N-terminal domain-containing protein [Agitococcus sp.]HMY28907.1 type IV pili methyl-accepting chemotaxis transducer N-terminal domain-containing protein [Agitococcus sp.]HNB19114.1 type IV pili methyl-accepting chemotaxis transducer N-terminal domain-containing protein [Agitococcus sp.]HNC03299.1 type IV pili methyl-accepting chemotaxis transducer N-terminal domain-containing protein [Agitococcus sp.]HNC86454.1 type IV pili methyl-acceptin